MNCTHVHGRGCIWLYTLKHTGEELVCQIFLDNTKSKPKKANNLKKTILNI